MILYRRMFMLFLLTRTITAYTSSAPTIISPDKLPVIINVNVNTGNHSEKIVNKPVFTAQTDTNATSTQHASVSTTLGVTLQAWSWQAYSYIAEQVKKIGDKLSQASNSAHHFFLSHKIKIICSIIAGLYLSCFGIIVADNYFLNNPQLWGNWLAHLSYQELCTCPEENMQHELILEIQRRYLQSTNPADFFSPLTTFINTIEYEEKRIARYITYTTWLGTLYLSYILPINDEKREQATTALKRTQFIRRCFLSWAAAYNFAHKNSLTF